MPKGKPKPPTKTEQEKQRQADVLERMQRDMDGYIDKYQEILDKRGDQYAKDIEPTWRKLGANVSRAITDLYNQYADENGQLDDTRLREMERLRFLQQQIGNMIYALKGDTEKLRNSLAYTYVDSAVFHAWALESATQLSIVTPALTHGHVMGILANPWLPDGATYSDRLRANTAYLAAKMQQTVTEAVGQGWDVQKTARRAAEVTGEGYHSSVRLARTELNRAASQGSSHTFMQNADILDGKRWRAVLDARTAPKDARNDGRVYDLSYDTPEHPGKAGERIPNHPNCRCKYSPVVSGVSEKVRERIARGDGDSKSRFGERIYTKSKNYREYAKERGLPDLYEALARENPKKYLRQGEGMEAYKIPSGRVTKKSASATALSVLTKPVPKPEPVKEPAGDPLASAVNERVSQGISSEADLREVGQIVADELQAQLPDDIAEMQKEMQSARKRYVEIAQELNDAFKQWGKSPEYTEVYRRLYPEYEQVRGEYFGLLDQVQRDRSPVLQGILARIRPMGGVKIDWQPGSHIATKNAIDSVTDLLPADWLAKSNAAGTLLAKSDKRGYYQEAYSGNNNQATIVLSGTLKADIKRVALHEMGHRFENVVPGISQYEQEFYLRRTKGETLTWLGAGHRRDEKTRVDNFVNPYMGKDYSANKDGRGEYYELLSMGLESLYSGNYDIDSDTDFRDFILGVLTAL